MKKNVNRFYSLTLFMLSALMIACQGEENRNPDEVTHVNSMPKDIRYYKVNPITNTDSLIVEIKLFKRMNSNFFDSILFNPYREYSRYYNDSVGEYEFKLNGSFLAYSDIVFYANNKLTQASPGSDNCDNSVGYYYTFEYDNLNRLSSYLKTKESDRCSGNEEWGEIEYKQDTVLVKRNGYTYADTDTLTYFDSTHVSYLPVFYLGNITATFPISDVYIYSNSPFSGRLLDFHAFSNFQFPLIKQNKSFISTFDYSYLFNDSNDIRQMNIVVNSILFGNSTYKILFEY